MPRPRRGAYIYRRPARRGWYAFVDRDHKDISLRTDDEATAQARLAEVLKRRGVRSPAQDDPTTLAECFTELLTRSRTAHTPKTTYEVGLNSRRILAWLEERHVFAARDVHRTVVEEYKESRRFQPSSKDAERKISAARVNRELDTWKQAMKVAVEWELCRKSVLDDFVKLREPRPHPHREGLTKDMIRKFLRAEPHRGYRALFRTVVGTGMRDDEARHLDASDIRPPWVVVTPKPGWTTKGYRHRSIPASAATIKAARQFVAAKSTMRLEPKTVWTRIQEARERAQIGLHFSMHDLRRAWASHMLAAGHRIDEISKWLGHADIMTTMRYLRVVTTSVPDPKSLPF